MRSWQVPGLSPGQTRVLIGTVFAHGMFGFVPLFGGPGYEAALALGIILPLPVACLSAVRAHRALLAGGPAPAVPGASPLELLGAEVRFAVLLSAVQLLVLSLHGARVGFCDPLAGVLSFLLGPAAGAVLAAAWGTLAGLGSAAIGRGRTLAVALASAGPIGGLLVSLVRFWTSPMVFAFDPYVGFFAGTLYDTVIDAIPRLVTYRAGSAGSLLAAVCLCGAARGARIDVRRHAGLLALGAAGFVSSLGVTYFGPELGHYQTTRTIREALGQSMQSERCEIVYARGILPERITLLGRECDAHIAAHEAYFETTLASRVVVFTFASARQKGELMGASNTYIAKPWRHEVYIQSDNYPHPVLAHELAHVVAGAFGRGPLAVAGPLGGWIPDPGRIEGFAVAAAPAEDSDYSLIEWSAALNELGLLPPLGSIFKLSFLGQNSATGYTVAGTVVEWLRGRHGASALRAWYGGASVEQAFGESLQALDGAFRAELAQRPVPERIRDIARARFDRPAIFGRRCPHVVDERLEAAALALEGFDVSTAAAAYQSSLELDPSNLSARLGLAACAERSGDGAGADARYLAVARDPALPRAQRASVLERLGDRELLAGRDDQADAHYAAAERDAFDEHRARTIAVKRYALENPDGRPAISALLIGDPRLGSDLAQATAELGEWAAKVPSLGLADYLIGKNLFSRARWRDAYVRLQRALRSELPLTSVRREALRTFVFAACALDERNVAQGALEDYLADPGLSSARKSGMQRFAKSCRLSITP